MRRSVIAGLVMLSLGGILLCAQPERKQKKPGKNDQKETVTQSLAVLPDPPPAVSGETSHLVFHVSPLSAKGLLSQQVRDALKALERDNRGAQILHLRAFVAGTGDVRRVQQIVAEVFSAKKQPLPVVTTLQVGALPLEGAQVVMESVSADKRSVNPAGIVFLMPRPFTEYKGLQGVLRLTCFLTAFEALDQVRRQVAAEFPNTPASFMQLTRVAGEPTTSCEAVAQVPAGGLTAPHSATPTNAVVFTGSKMVFSGLQMAFRDDDADVRLALDRLKKSVESLGGHMDGAYVSIYTIARPSALAAAKIAAGAVGRGVQPMMFEGLPSLDAAVGMDLITAADSANLVH